jgi:hypothetical protein
MGRFKVQQSWKALSIFDRIPCQQVSPGISSEIPGEGFQRDYSELQNIGRLVPVTTFERFERALPLACSDNAFCDVGSIFEDLAPASDASAGCRFGTRLYRSILATTC